MYSGKGIERQCDCCGKVQVMSNPSFSKNGMKGKITFYTGRETIKEPDLCTDCVKELLKEWISQV